ncbi:MAG: hypothetical protein U5K76_12380 [Woeseiaceae bacterium]|nr:hypothetical protein [Woeseiaceae bacterium]
MLEQIATVGVELIGILPAGDNDQVRLEIADDRTDELFHRGPVDLVAAAVWQRYVEIKSPAVCMSDLVDLPGLRMVRAP